MNIHGHDVDIITAYAPTDYETVANKAKLFDELTTLLESVNSRSEIFLMEDANKAWKEEKMTIIMARR